MRLQLAIYYQLANDFERSNALIRQIVAASNSALKLEPILKWDFYKAVESNDHILTVQTGDQALWANVLLTMGCRTA